MFYVTVILNLTQKGCMWQVHIPSNYAWSFHLVGIRRKVREILKRLAWTHGQWKADSAVAVRGKHRKLIRLPMISHTMWYDTLLPDFHKLCFCSLKIGYYSVAQTESKITVWPGWPHCEAILTSWPVESWLWVWSHHRRLTLIYFVFLFFLFIIFSIIYFNLICICCFLMYNFSHSRKQELIKKSYSRANASKGVEKIHGDVFVEMP